MKDLDAFFDHLQGFAHREIFENIEFIWDPLKNLEDSITGILTQLAQRGRWVEISEKFVTAKFYAREGRVNEKCLFVDQWIEVISPAYFEELGIYIGEGTILEPTAIIKGPALIGKNCEIRQGAYIRGNAMVGDHCIIGHATEVKNTIIMNHTEAGHFNYIGDSIIGSYVNLGAGSRLANLQFRTPEEKRELFINPIKIQLGQDEVNTGMEKLGAILGDYVELGCNTVTCPGVLMGKNNWVYPNTTLPKGFYEPNQILGSKDRKIGRQGK